MDKAQLAYKVCGLVNNIPTIIGFVKASTYNEAAEIALAEFPDRLYVRAIHTKEDTEWLNFALQLEKNRLEMKKVGDNVIISITDKPRMGGLACEICQAT